MIFFFRLPQANVATGPCIPSDHCLGNTGLVGVGVNSRFQSMRFKHQLYKICKTDHVAVAI